MIPSINFHDLIFCLALSLDMARAAIATRARFVVFDASRNNRS